MSGLGCRDRLDVGGMSYRFLCPGLPPPPPRFHRFGSSVDAAADAETGDGQVGCAASNSDQVWFSSVGAFFMHDRSSTELYAIGRGPLPGCRVCAYP
jgi:hypothetical protein